MRGDVSLLLDSTDSRGMYLKDADAEALAVNASQCVN